MLTGFEGLYNMMSFLNFNPYPVYVKRVGNAYFVVCYWLL